MGENRVNQDAYPMLFMSQAAGTGARHPSSHITTTAPPHDTLQSFHSPRLCPPRSGWLGPPATRCVDAAACTTWRILMWTVGLSCACLSSERLLWCVPDDDDDDNSAAPTALQG